jgi:hypothetical protein
MGNTKSQPNKSEVKRAHREELLKATEDYINRVADKSLETYLDKYSIDELYDLLDGMVGILERYPEHKTARETCKKIIDKLKEKEKEKDDNISGELRMSRELRMITAECALSIQTSLMEVAESQERICRTLERLNNPF